MISTIFPNSNSDIDKYIILLSDPCSRLALSGVNKTASLILSNNVFEFLCRREHPLLKEDTYKNSLALLCTCHPSNCWKVASYFFATGTFNPSCSFLGESFPFFQSLLRSRKEQTEMELKRICGSYYADPDSPIDQAWKACGQARKAYEASEKAFKESTEAFSCVARCKDFGSENLEVTQAYNKIKFAGSELSEYAIKLVISPSSRIRAGEKFMEFRHLDPVSFSDIEELRSAEVFKININSFEELIKVVSLEESGLSENILSLFHEDLFPEYLILFKFIFYKKLQLHFKNSEMEVRYREKEILLGKYCEMEGSRRENSKWLEKINVCIHALDKKNTFQLDDSRDDLKKRFKLDTTYRMALRGELDFFIGMEENKKDKNALEQCLIALDKVNEHSENPILLDSIRQSINSCPYGLRTVVWGTLYERCANGITEDSWSENHYGEFLPDLKDIVESKIILYKKVCDCLGDSLSADKLSTLMEKFITC
jgi:hypothetical protein